MSDTFDIKWWHAVIGVVVLAVGYVVFTLARKAYCSYKGTTCGVEKLACDAGNAGNALLPWNWMNGWRPTNCASRESDCKGSFCSGV